MKTFPEAIKRIISLSMIFVLLVQQYGCVTSNIISTANLQAYSPEFAYAIHCHKSVYVLQKIVVVNDTLTGKIYNPDFDVLTTGNFIRIYPTADSIVKISPEKILRLPLAGIKHVKSIEEDPSKTTALVLGSIILTLLLLIGIGISSMHFSIDI
jgi:hypothetical protein